MRKLLLIIVVVLAACSSKPPPVLPPPIPPPPIDPYPSRTAPFRWYLARGSSWFSGTSATPQQIISQFDELHAEWTNLWPTVRTCAERARWPEDHPYLFKGPNAFPFDERSPAYADLEKFLKVSASIPHAQVLLVAVCTLKENWSDAAITDGRAFDANEKWVRTVCRAASRYENVAIEVINEWRHPNSIYEKLGRRYEQVIRMIQVCREEAPGTLIGTDTNVNKNRMAYDPILASYVDFYSFHPWRNPDPDEDEIRVMVRQRIGAAVLSETTCYDVGAPARGNCTGDWDQILAYQRDTERKGGVFFYHTKFRGLCDPRGDCGTLEPITPRGDHPIKHGR